VAGRQQSDTQQAEHNSSSQAELLDSCDRSLCLSLLCCFYCAAVDFFNEISLLYGTITEFCTSQTCPVMSASAQFEYLWCDNQVRNERKTAAKTENEAASWSLAW
jgi:hypothetical protein